MSNLNDVAIEKIEKIQSCNNAILTCADLLIAFDIDDNFSNQIPSNLKNENVRLGLMECIRLAGYASMSTAEWLDGIHRK